MVRLARIVVPGCAHHITQRGNRRADVFCCERDYEKYLELCKMYFCRHGLEIYAYCLMSNHVHFVAVPNHTKSLGLAFRDTHQAYSAYFNRQLGETGHLWQGRFFSSPLDENHLWAAVRYVEMNPVRAGMVEHAVEYKWSSASAHCGQGTNDLLSPDFTPKGVIDDWQRWLEFENIEQENKLRKHVETGRPVGNDSFIERIGKLVGRSLKKKKPGPKLKDN